MRGRFHHAANDRKRRSVRDPDRTYEWRGDFSTTTKERTARRRFRDARFDASEMDWIGTGRRHSLGWVVARDENGAIVGLVNVLGTASVHAWIQDTDGREAVRAAEPTERARSRSRASRAHGRGCDVDPRQISRTTCAPSLLRRLRLSRRERRDSSSASDRDRFETHSIKRTTNERGVRVGRNNQSPLQNTAGSSRPSSAPDGERRHNCGWVLCSAPISARRSRNRGDRVRQRRTVRSSTTGALRECGHGDLNGGAPRRPGRVTSTGRIRTARAGRSAIARVVRLLDDLPSAGTVRASFSLVIAHVATSWGFREHARRGSRR